jgi:putative YhbY family RNA-binding protein
LEPPAPLTLRGRGELEPPAPLTLRGTGELELSRDERLRLKSESHHLEPVVLLGANGLTEAALKEIDRALTAHQLVKVRAPASERGDRERLFVEVAERLGAARIQLIGRLMVLFRPLPDDPHPRAVSPTPLPKGEGPIPPVSTRSGDRGGGEVRAPSPARERGSDNSPRPRSGRGARR